MTNIIIRPPPVARQGGPPQYPHGGGVVIACQYHDTLNGSKVAALGAAVSSPENKNFHGKKLKRIARARLTDSPVRLQFDNLEAELRQVHVRSAFRALLIEAPRWSYVDDEVLRPGRFTQRWGARLLGPDGSLLTAYIDFLHRPRTRPSNLLIQPGARALSHWVLRLPRWAREVV